MTNIDKIYNFSATLIKTFLSSFTPALLTLQTNIIQFNPSSPISNQQPPQLYITQSHQQNLSPQPPLIQLNHCTQQQKIKNYNHQLSQQKIRRIKQIQLQKKIITQNLNQVNQQIQQLTGKNRTENIYKKYQKISKDQNAQKQAQQLIRQLRHRRQQKQIKKKLQLQKLLQQNLKFTQQHKKNHQQQLQRKQTSKRKQIIQRMLYEKRRKHQRQIIDSQSNQLIQKLKKQSQQLSKIINQSTNHLTQFQPQPKSNPKKNPYTLQQLSQHNKNYQLLKQSLKRQKIKQLQLQKQTIHTNQYTKSIWSKIIQQQQLNKKQQQKSIAENKKIQLQKKIKYSQLVKKIFIPNQKYQQSISVSTYNNHQHSHSKTPQNQLYLPKIKPSYSMKNNLKQSSIQNQKPSNKLAKQKPLHNSLKPPTQQQKKKQQLLRQQTKQRLKKLQNLPQNSSQLPQQKIKYQNYLGHFHPKNPNHHHHSWKSIINNPHLPLQQKLQLLIQQAQTLQSKAKLKSSLLSHPSNDQQTINLYIASIQAKIAILSKL